MERMREQVKDPWLRPDGAGIRAVKNGGSLDIYKKIVTVQDGTSSCPAPGRTIVLNYYKKF